MLIWGKSEPFNIGHRILVSYYAIVPSKICVRLIPKPSSLYYTTYLFYYLQIGLEVCIFLHRKFHLKNDWVVVKKPFTIFLIKLSFILSTVGAEVKRQGPSRQEKKFFFWHISLRPLSDEDSLIFFLNRYFRSCSPQPPAT